MTIDITGIIQEIFFLIASIATVFIIPYFRRKISENQFEEIKSWVNIAVQAAEQIYTGPGRGTEKKEYVITWLNERNITFDVETIDALIEAAVYTLKN